MKRRVVGPERELAFGGVAGEEVEDGGGEELLRVGELDGGGRRKSGRGCDDGVAGEEGGRS